jgi:hypothetical protein
MAIRVMAPLTVVDRTDPLVAGRTRTLIARTILAIRTMIALTGNEIPSPVAAVMSRRPPVLH